MGGAGGGGVYWLAGDTHPGVNRSFLTGTNGVFQAAPFPMIPWSLPGQPYKRNDLVAPLRGFLFNPVPSDYTYCSDVDPDPIVASDPKGGEGTLYLPVDRQLKHPEFLGQYARGQ